MSSGRLPLVSGLILAIATTVHFASSSGSSPVIFLHALSALAMAFWLLRQDRKLTWILLTLAALAWSGAQLLRLPTIDVLAKQDVVALGLAIANILIFSATAKAQDDILPRETRTVRTIEGLLLALSVLALEWFFAFETNAIDGFNSIPSHRDEAILVIGQVMASLPFIAVLLFLMNSSKYRAGLYWATLGVTCTTVFSVTWFNVKVYRSAPLDPRWDLLAMVGIVVFAHSLSLSKRAKSSESQSLRLSLLPYVLGVFTIFTGVVHSAVSGVHFADLVIVALLGMILVVRQTYSYVEQRRLLGLVSRHESQMRQLAMHDSLTSLANRALFQDRLQHAVAVRQRDGSEISLIHLDIDDFKRINDQFGYAIGDEVLMHIARRLATWVRPSDTVARLGSDEFAVLMEADQQGALRVADRLAVELSRTFELANQHVNISASVGLATFRPSSTQGGDPIRLAERLVNRAEAALHIAKVDRRGGVVVSQEENSTNA